MPADPIPEPTEITSGLMVRGIGVMSDEEVAILQRSVGEELLVSSTLRAWFAGEDVPPHSVGVALETQLRMLFGEPAEACATLITVLDRLAEAFPSEVQPLDTT